jgi:carbonic anhydrase/acetyltransferase-like protein (isoleucine patch superfamily)
MLRKKLNKLITGWKGSGYVIDEKVPGTYLLRLVQERMFMLLRGYVSGIKNEGLLFFSWKAKVRMRSMMRVGRSVTINSGAFIDALSREGVLLGNNVSVGRLTRIECTGNLQHLGYGLQVGNNTGLGIACFYGCAGGIRIGNDVMVGDFVSFHAENHVTRDVNVLMRLQGVEHKGIAIGNNCWIGAKATILDGAIVEDGCVIAAGAVVTAGVYKANGIYGGVPAKLIKYRSAE